MESNKLFQALIDLYALEIRYKQIFNQETMGYDVDNNVIESVFLMLSNNEWCHSVSNIGDDYIGGCCGTTSAMQDIWCHTFRMGGWLSSNNLLALADMAYGHPDGFELWHKDMSEKEELKLVKRWKKLGVWDKLGLIYRATKDNLKEGWLLGSSPISALFFEEKKQLRTFAALSSAANYFSRREIKAPKDELDDDQRHATKTIVYSKLIHSINEVNKIISVTTIEPFSGFAVVDTNDRDNVQSNGYGYCIYETKERAQELIDRWVESESKRAGLFEIRPVRITVEAGLVFVD